MNNPLISVCVICYNQKEYIADCLNSIVSQVCEIPFEVVVGDDCSTDGTREIVEDFEKRYPKLVRCLPKESNLGAVPNFLRTASACQGDVIAFCEGDDYWIDSVKLTRQYHALDNFKNVDIVFNPAVVKHHNGALPDGLMSYFGRAERVLPLGEIIVRRGGVIPSPSLMIRKPIIDQLPFWLSELDGCDFFLKIVAAQRGGALYLPYIMSAYRFMSKGSWSERYLTNNEYEAKQVVLQWNALRKLEKHLEFSETNNHYFSILRADYVFQVALSQRIGQSTKIATLNELSCETPIFTRYVAKSGAYSAVARFILIYLRKIMRVRRFISRIRDQFQLSH